MKILVVHGCAATERDEASLVREWLPAMQDGLAMAGFPVPDLEMEAVSTDVGVRWSPGPPAREETDGTRLAADAARLVAHWWATHGADSRAQSRSRTSPGKSALDDLLACLGSIRYFCGIPPDELFEVARSVIAHIYDPDLRKTCKDRVKARLTAGVPVVVCHSLGSVAAYDAVNADAGGQRSLITLGSPIGLPHILADAGQGPVAAQSLDRTAIREWCNIADVNDALAQPAQLSPVFGDPVRDVALSCRPMARAVRPYLATREFGEALAAGLRRRP